MIYNFFKFMHGDTDHPYHNIYLENGLTYQKNNSINFSEVKKFHVKMTQRLEK